MPVVGLMLDIHPIGLGTTEALNGSYGSGDGSIVGR